MKQVSEGNIKITPEVLIQGGGTQEGASSANMLSAFMASLMLDKMNIPSGKAAQE